jgi:soluble lytic murein transglycosylase
LIAALSARSVAFAWLATAVAVATPAGAQAIASPATITLVAAARGYDRANVLDSARSGYDSAAGELPSIADWLRLRAAGVTPDSAGRSHYYSAVSNTVALERVMWTEAEARERFRDFAGAADAYGALGARVDALRARAEAVQSTGDSTARDTLRRQLFVFIAGASGTPDARTASEIADRFLAPLTTAEERTVVMSALVTGPLTRAASGFDHVRATVGDTALTASEMLLYGTLLTRVHREADAIRVLSSLMARPGPAVPPPFRNAAEYQRARALVGMGDKTAAEHALTELVRAAPKDTVSASALMLLADLATDARDDAAAGRYFEQVGNRFPENPLAPRARFRAALILFVAGSMRPAAREWDSLAHEYPRSDDAVAARYWSGRAWARAGQRRLAADRWRGILASDPLSYYASLSARRLETPTPVAGIAAAGDTATVAPPPGIDSALARAALLETLGMAVEARFEVDAAMRESGNTSDAMLVSGAALVRAGEPSRGVSIGWRLLGRSDTAWRDPRVVRLVYPLLFGDTLKSAAQSKGLDPALVAALVRQESAFNPKAVSISGARGLMQIMPSVGRSLAQSRGIGPWDPDLLDDPALNLTFGVAHFATFLSQQDGNVVRTLAAYNAGPSRVVTWSAKRGVDDPEVFVERIPFNETRDYVRAIMRGRDVYAALYGL